LEVTAPSATEPALTRTFAAPRAGGAEMGHGGVHRPVEPPGRLVRTETHDGREAGESHDRLAGLLTTLEGESR
jgi:hypothetical protein